MKIVYSSLFKLHGTVNKSPTGSENQSNTYVIGTKIPKRARKITSAK